MPDYIRELITDEAVVLNVPREMRELALDYIRDCGAIVAEGSRASRWTLLARVRTEWVFIGVLRQKVIVDTELMHRGDDRSERVAFRGRGEELFHGTDFPEAVAAAGRQALEHLSE